MLVVRGLPLRWFKLLCVSLALVFLTFDRVNATEPTTGSDQTAAKRKFIPARPPGGGPVLKEIRRRPNDHTVAVLLHQYDTLQATIQKEMELTPEQAGKIVAVIDTYRRQARENTHLIGLFHVSTAARFHGGRIGPQSPPPLLEVSNLTSSPAADPDSTAELEIIDGDFYEYHDMILAEVYFAVDDREQRKRLWPILMRWLTLQRPPAHRDGPMARLLRCVRDPALDISDEQRAELMEFVSSRMRQHFDDRYKEEVLRPVADALRDEVAEKLAPGPREHFLKSVKLAHEEAAMVEKIIAEVEAKKVAKPEKTEESEKQP